MKTPDFAALYPGYALRVFRGGLRFANPPYESPFVSKGEDRNPDFAESSPDGACPHLMRGSGTPSGYALRVFHGGLRFANPPYESPFVPKGEDRNPDFAEFTPDGACPHLMRGSGTPSGYALRVFHGGLRFANPPYESPFVPKGAKTKAHHPAPLPGGERGEEDARRRKHE